MIGEVYLYNTVFFLLGVSRMPKLPIRDCFVLVEWVSLPCVCSYLRSSERHILTFFQGLCYSPYALRLDRLQSPGNMTGEHVPA